MRYITVQLLFWLGHSTSLLTDAVATDWPHGPEWIVDWLYRCYSRLMQWSADLDVNESVWLKRHDGETEGEFEARCVRRWPWLAE